MLANLPLNQALNYEVHVRFWMQVVAVPARCWLVFCTRPLWTGFAKLSAAGGVRDMPGLKHVRCTALNAGTRDRLCLARPRCLCLLSRCRCRFLRQPVFSPCYGV